MEIKNESVTAYFEKSTKIEILDNGKNFSFSQNDVIFKTIINELMNTTKNARDMPAYGVSLNDEVVDAKSNGIWLEIYFDKTQYFNEMPFDSLLFEVNKGWTGFNLHRKNSGKYQGRCFYLSLDGNMENLYNKLFEIVNGK